MNKSELIEAVTERLGDRKSASTAVEAVVDAITRAVAKGEKVGISGFGVFEKVERAARTARNPSTGAAVKLKKTSVPKFRPGQGFKDIVSGAKKVPPPPKAGAPALPGLV
ncbi:MAG: HU family DNA-binding protein [Frankiaceae bacterium]|nr:HU family DNA-binding protein [Frankiaceae bacterium]